MTADRSVAGINRMGFSNGGQSIVPKRGISPPAAHPGHPRDFRSSISPTGLKPSAKKPGRRYPLFVRGARKVTCVASSQRHRHLFTLFATVTSQPLALASTSQTLLNSFDNIHCESTPNCATAPDEQVSHLSPDFAQFASSSVDYALPVHLRWSPLSLLLLAPTGRPPPLAEGGWGQPSSQPASSANHYTTFAQNDQHIHPRPDTGISLHPRTSEEKAECYKGPTQLPPLRCAEKGSKWHSHRRTQGAVRICPQCCANRSGHKRDYGQAGKIGTV